MTAITVKVPAVPPRECSPNWRGHWSRRSSASRYFKDMVYMHAIDARNTRGVAFPLKKATLSLEVIYTTTRRRDLDNIVAMFKPGLDGLVKAELLTDDDAKHLKLGDINTRVGDTKTTIITLTERG